MSQGKRTCRARTFQARAFASVSWAGPAVVVDYDIDRAQEFSAQRRGTTFTASDRGTVFSARDRGTVLTATERQQ